MVTAAGTMQDDGAQVRINSANKEANIIPRLQAVNEQISLLKQASGQGAGESGADGDGSGGGAPGGMDDAG